MKILILHSDYSWNGGTTRMAIFLANHLKNDKDNILLGDFSSNRVMNFIVNDNIQFFSLPNEGYFYRVRGLRRLIKKEKIDVLISVDIGMAIISLPAICGLKIKHIVWEHSNYLNTWNSFLIPVVRKLSRLFADSIVVLTRRDKERYLVKTFGKAKITCIHNAVSKDCVAEENKYDNNSKTIICVANFIPVKRLDLLIEVAKKIFVKFPDWHLDVWGEGKLKDFLLEQIYVNNLEKNIYLRGTTKNIYAEYKKASICVMTSEMEGLPMVLLEAKSHGLPIVSFDIETGPSDIVRDGVNGYLVEFGDTDAMAEKICRLIENDELRKSFSDNSALDLDKFDEEEIVRKWEELIEKIQKPKSCFFLKRLTREE